MSFWKATLIFSGLGLFVLMFPAGYRIGLETGRAEKSKQELHNQANTPRNHINAAMFHLIRAEMLLEESGHELYVEPD